MAGIRRFVVFVCALGVLFVAAPAAGAAVLYDQTDNAGTPNADSEAPNFSPSNDFGGDGDRTADDFTVPAGHTWHLDEVEVSGAYENTPPPEVNAFVYSDASGVPGTEVFSQSGIAATGGPDYVVPLTGGPTLGPGVYWVTIQQAGAGSGYWSWTTRTVQTGSPARWFSETSGPPGCPAVTWNSRTACWPGTNPDQVFKLAGTDTADNTFTLATPKRNKKKGTAVLPVTVPGAGDVTLTGKNLAPQRPARPAARPVSGPGTVDLLVKPKGKLKKKLKRKGKAEASVTVTYTPTPNGTSSAQTTKVKLKRKRAR